MAEGRNESIFPEIRVFSPIKAICGCLGNLASRIPTMLPNETITFLSGHVDHDHGAEAMLAPVLPFPERDVDPEPEAA